jgi:hypothetical protein
MKQCLRSFWIILYLAPIWIGAAAIGGCAYSFTGAAVPAHWKSIAIPLFDDESNFGQPSLREDLTNMLIQKFQRDNTLRLSEQRVGDRRTERYDHHRDSGSAHRRFRRRAGDPDAGCAENTSHAH